MEAFLVTHEAALLSALFYGTIIVVVVWELLLSRCALTRPSWIRWLGNMGLGVFNTLINRWLVSVVGLSGAIVAEQQNWGLLNQMLLPEPVTIVAGVMLLDLSQYFVHRVFHAVPALWPHQPS